eukprot:TRINITY_DN8176_c0_g1_i1.p1 TRINITY_DN8176_c0_g1~~TRINITY_DN8176_c0_g1_i1.p1  ORF type:complete len:585 (+),score=261.65 TRINITY_DN8176_c0_g1_i1:98-1756(+)
MPGKKQGKEKKDEAKKTSGGEEGGDAADPEAQLAMLIASTFANNELESKKRTLEEAQKVSERQRKENERLREELLHRDSVSLHVNEFLSKEVEKKQVLIEQWKTQIEEEREKATGLLRDREDELNAVISDKDDLLAEKDKDIARLEAELESVASHKRDKHEMEELIENLKNTLAQTKEKYERELSKLRFQSLKEKVRLKHEEKDLNDRFSSTVNQRAMELLDGQTRTIHAENEELRKNHHTLEREYMLLSKQVKSLEDEKRKKEREIQLSAHSIEEYSRQSHRAHKEIKTLALRNRQLEDNAGMLARQHESEKQDATVERNGAVENLALTLKETQQALKIRTLELHRIKRLARVIIQQRSDLELFFTEALEHIRAQCAIERHQQGLAVVKYGGTGRSGGSSGRHRAAHNSSFARGDFLPVMQETSDGKLGTPTELPPIPRQPKDRDSQASDAMSDAQSTVDGKDGAEPPRVDIADLSWTDKERVLRILFAKISTSQGTAPKERLGKRTPQLSPTVTATSQQLLEFNNAGDGTTFLTQSPEGPVDALSEMVGH